MNRKALICYIEAEIKKSPAPLGAGGGFRVQKRENIMSFSAMGKVTE
jgi:hypothetical protein